MSSKSSVWSKALTALIVLSAQFFTLSAADSPPGAALPEVRVIASDPVALEKVSTAAFIFTRSGPTTNALTVNFTVGGTASNGVTYTLIPNSVTIPAGSILADILVQPTDDHLDLGNQTVTVTLSTNASYNVSSASKATITIVDNSFNNVPPTVAITSPTNRTVFAAPANVLITASASDADDAIAQVSFYDGDHLLGAVTNAPYSFTLSNATVGNHTLTARAQDALGKTAVSAAVRISVTNTPPTVALTSPTNSSVFQAGANISLAATASDTDEGIAKVSFYAGDKLIGSVTNAPYLLTWSNVAPGEYGLTAVATDAVGATAASKGVVISVTKGTPVLSWLSPTNGSSFTFPANVVLSVTASETNGSIAKVTFSSGDKVLGTVTNAPYSLTWSNVPPGQYVVTARAYDQFGVASAPAAIKLSVNATLPTVSFVTPTNGSVFPQLANIPVTVTAGATSGIAQVVIASGDHVLGTFTNAPYSLVLSNAAAGRYTLTARAKDNMGLVSSAQVSFTVTNPVPVVTLTSPASGASFAPGSNIALAADASETGGTISKVSFYSGDKLLGTATNTPYSLVWSNVSVGKYSLAARATEAKGNVGTSKAVGISVTNNVVPPPVTNSLPFVAITSPTNGAVFGIPANIQLTATATNAGNTIKSVSFYGNDKLLGTVTNQPYSLNWSNVAPGSYSLFARATDTAGKSAYSSAIRVHVTNAAPVVTVTSPTNNATFVAPASISLAATASDTDDSVIRVAFYYNGNHLIGYLTNAPYTLSWTNVHPGRYSIQAHATDAHGGDTWSDAVHITVNPSSGVTPAGLEKDHGNVAITAVERLGDGSAEVSVDAASSTAVLLESSSDLSSWQPVATMLVRDGVAVFVDAAGGNGQPRFYRASPAE